MWSARRQAAVLLAIGIVTGLAALLAPAARIVGVDLGATGSALFGFVLLAYIVLFSRSADDVFPEDSSVAERRAWIGSLFLGLVLLSFLRFMWVLSHEPTLPATLDDFYARHFMQHLVGLVVAWQLLSYMVGRRAGTVQLDERDLRLQHAASRAGDWVLTVIVIVAVCALALLPALLPAPLLAWWLAPIVLANLLIGLLTARSLVERLVLTLAYRVARG